MRRQASPIDPAVEAVLQTLRLGAEVDAAGLARRWAAVDPAGLAALVEYEGCVLWLYQRLQELHILGAAPTEFVEWLSARAHRLLAYTLGVDAQRDQLVRLLNEFRVPHVLLKGAARRLMADVHASGSARPTTDVDVLVPHEFAGPTWARLQSAGFVSTPGPGFTCEGHFHLPPLRHGGGVAVELHTSTSTFVPAPVAWERMRGSARVAQCQGGPTQVPSATELLWHGITHAPLPHAGAFRIRYFQDAAVSWAARAEIDWDQISTRLASLELPDPILARGWLGTAWDLVQPDRSTRPIGTASALHLGRALTWRLTVFRRFGEARSDAAPQVWGPRLVSRGRRLLIDEATRAELGLPLIPQPRTAFAPRAGRRLAAAAARVCYRGWCTLRRAQTPMEE